jgi:hypothetical protein
MHSFTVLIGLGLMSTFVINSGAKAEWRSKVEDIGFGERSAFAASFEGSVPLLVGCESSKEAAYLRIPTPEKADGPVNDFGAEIQISIDGGEPVSFTAATSRNRAEKLMLSADLDESEAREVVDLIGGAKRAIAFRVKIGSKNFYSNSVSASGSRRAMKQVEEICKVGPPSAQPPQNNKERSDANIFAVTEAYRLGTFAAMRDFCNLTFTSETEKLAEHALLKTKDLYLKGFRDAELRQSNCEPNAALKGPVYKKNR